MGKEKEGGRRYMERNLRGFGGWFFWEFYGRKRGGSLVIKEKRKLEEEVH